MSFLSKVLNKQGDADKPRRPEPLPDVTSVELIEHETHVEIPLDDDDDSKDAEYVSIVCVSDTHNQAEKIPTPIPKADILVHAGDFTNTGTPKQITRFNQWVATLLKQGTVKHVVLIAGNHDCTLHSEFYKESGFRFHPAKESQNFCEHHQNLLDNAQAEFKKTKAIYLFDEPLELMGVKFYGSPWQPWFCDWAFNLQRGAALREKWEKIPDDVDVLITHGPPKFHGDLVPSGNHEGCEELRAVVKRIEPPFHVFGHIHEGYGVTREPKIKSTFINASTCTLRYKPTNKPVLFKIRRRTEAATDEIEDQ